MIRHVIIKAHLQEAHVQSKELQGCQAHREPQEPGAGGAGVGEGASRICSIFRPRYPDKRPSSPTSGLYDGTQVFLVVLTHILYCQN